MSLFGTTLPTAEDLMRRRLVAVRPGEGVLAAVDRMLRFNVSGAPVIDDDGRYVGVFSEKTSLSALSECVTAVDPAVRVENFMTRSLHTVGPQDEVFDAIESLLGRQISGAPVLDADGNYLGVFSEKTAMRAMIASLADSFPGGTVRSFMNLDRNRLIQRHAGLTDVVEKILETPYRRFPIVEDGRLVGQVSRRDVLRAAHRVAAEGGCRGAFDMTVSQWVDTDALTVTPETDLFMIATIFLQSPYRRLPVLQDGGVVGMVSRRDLLAVGCGMGRPAATDRSFEPLYLSGFDDRTFTA